MTNLGIMSNLDLGLNGRRAWCRGQRAKGIVHRAKGREQRA